MNWQTLLFYLLLVMLLFTSCQKEKANCTAVVSLYFSNKETIEWAEVAADWPNLSQEISIEAWGYNNERFSLQLHQVSDTGSITGITLSQLSCSDGAFFPQRVEAGVIHIVERNDHRLSGNFEVLFPDYSRPANPVRATGTFDLYR